MLLGFLKSLSMAGLGRLAILLAGLGIAAGRELSFDLFLEVGCQ